VDFAIAGQIDTSTFEADAFDDGCRCEYNQCRNDKDKQMIQMERHLKLWGCKTLTVEKPNSLQR
jgi:hypothetical protein